MKIASVLLFVFSVFSSPAEASSRPNTLNLRCAQAQALLARHGNLVMYTGPNVFHLFQTHGGTSRALVQTKDALNCPLGSIFVNQVDAPPYVHIRTQNVSCAEGLRVANGVDEFNRVTSYRICQGGRWVLDRSYVYAEERAESGGSGISVIGTSKPVR